MTEKNQFEKKLKSTKKQLKIITALTVIAVVLFVVLLINPNGISPDTAVSVEKIVELNDDLIENGIHVRTGFKDAEGLMTVVQNCTSCHSSKLVIQNRMNADRWNATIKWMQETQNLWDLGTNQEVIVNYLVKNYPTIDKGRRANLQDVDWYELNK